MATSKIDYKSECLTFIKLKEAGEKVTIKAFCERRSTDTGKPLSFHYFKKVLGKIKPKGGPKAKPAHLEKDRSTPCAPSHDWPALRDDYITWRFASLAEVARHVGMHWNSRAFRTAVAGWKAARDAADRPGLPDTAEALAKQRSQQKARELYAEALAAYIQLFDIVKDGAQNCHRRWQDADKTPWHTQMAAQAVLDLARAMEKLLPAIKGLENLQAIHRIFDGLQDGTMDLPHAAIDFARLGVSLPKPIEILLAKYKPAEELPDDGDEITDEAIMARRAELLAEIESERVEFVRKRKRLVAGLKKRTAGTDSFAAQAREESRPVSAQPVD